MELLLCLDPKGGMMFNHRRQTFDKVVTDEIVNNVKSVNGTLWISDYSKWLFEDYDVPTKNIADFSVQNSSDTDFVFVEDIDIDFDALLSSEQQNQIVFYIWDKVYPADKKTSLDPNNIPGFKLEEKNEINTPVHEPIVKLVWKKKEN
jgi:hypothetical protein